MRFDFALTALFSIVMMSPAMADDDSANPDAEAFALAQPAFTTPIVLELGPDASSEASEIAALHGIYGEGPLNQAPKNYSLCLLDSKNPIADLGRAPQFIARVKGVDIAQTVLVDWLVRNNVVLFKDFKVRNSYAQRTYSCPLLNIDLLKRLRSETPQMVANLWTNAATIVVGKRVLARWTYRNTYTTPFPGKGDVKVFAGTFTYKIDPINNSSLKVSFPTAGTWKIKMYLDPDNGKWTVIDSKDDSPTINLTMADPAHPALMTDPVPVNIPRTAPVPTGHPTELPMTIPANGITGTIGLHGKQMEYRGAIGLEMHIVYGGIQECIVGVNCPLSGEISYVYFKNITSQPVQVLYWFLP
jgi:hypothetical protein